MNHGLDPCARYLERRQILQLPPLSLQHHRGTQLRPSSSADNKTSDRCGRTCVSPSAAKADSENEAVIAAVNRCATQNQVQTPERLRVLTFRTLSPNRAGW